ncbi:hypothetical protein ACSQ67_014964 [Phaseolus vulgaris]
MKGRGMRGLDKYWTELECHGSVQDLKVPRGCRMTSCLQDLWDRFSRCGGGYPYEFRVLECMNKHHRFNIGARSNTKLERIHIHLLLLDEVITPLLKAHVSRIRGSRKSGSLKSITLGWLVTLVVYVGVTWMVLGVMVTTCVGGPGCYKLKFGDPDYLSGCLSLRVTTMVVATGPRKLIPKAKSECATSSYMVFGLMLPSGFGMLFEWYK